MSYVVPEDGISEIYIHDGRGGNSYRNEEGVHYSLKKYKSKRKRQPKFWLISRDNIKLKIYVSEILGKKYGYGKKSLDLLVIRFGKKQLTITTYKNGWLYLNILFIRHIYNKTT